MCDGRPTAGGGSSREAAFAFDAYGIRCVIAPNFRDIFFGNCIKSGILPVRLEKAETDGLRRQLWDAPGARISDDLEAQTVAGPDGTAHRFKMDIFDKRNLLRGLSQIGLTFHSR